MQIDDIVSEEYVAFTPDTRASKLVGAFEDPAVGGVVVYGDAFEGVVTRRDLATSRHQPEQKVESLARPGPRLGPDEDVRKVARLMVESGTYFLPVFEGRELLGVVTDDDLLRKVRPFLDVATVADVYTSELVSVAPDATLGKALNCLRENGITHLPVVEDGAAVGVLSTHDLAPLTVRAVGPSRGGDVGGTDAHGGPITESAGRTRGGGFGAREGETTRVLDLPVRDVMVSPVRTVRPHETLDTAAAALLDGGGSSLVVTDDDGTPVGIVTETDLLDALTWEREGNRAVQVYGSDLLDDVEYDELVEMVEAFDDREVPVIDARIHLHEHDETRRGTPLLLARIRLQTDRGLFLASGEGYGARSALDEAREVLERRVRDEKTYGRSKKPASEEFWEKRFGWQLEG